MTSLKLTPNQQRVNLAEYRRQEWVVTPEAGVTLQNLLDPTFWSHVSGRMKPMDIVEVFIEDGSAYYRMMVTSCNRIAANLIVLYSKDLTAEEQETFNTPVASAANNYEAKWQGPAEKWIVLRTKDKAKVKTGFGSREEAEAHIKDLALAA